MTPTNWNMKSLLQEILDFDKGSDCLDCKLYETYRNYLKGRLLQEFSTEDLHNIFVQDATKHIPTSQRVDILANTFKNTKYFEKERDEKTGKLKRIPSVRTNLQLSNREYCTKEKFKAEFLKDEFKTEKETQEAETLVTALLKLFDEDGWLKHCT